MRSLASRLEALEARVAALTPPEKPAEVEVDFDELVRLVLTDREALRELCVDSAGHPVPIVLPDPPEGLEGKELLAWLVTEEARPIEIPPGGVITRSNPSGELQALEYAPPVLGPARQPEQETIIDQAVEPVPEPMAPAVRYPTNLHELNEARDKWGTIDGFTPQPPAGPRDMSLEAQRERYARRLLGDFAAGF